MQAALNAIAGDQLGPGLAALAIGMAVRADGRDVDLTTRDLSAVFSHPARKLAVFVHGLAETEHSWQRRSTESEPYGPRLQAEHGYTPIYVRYNTGRHVSDNGHDLGRDGAQPDELALGADGPLYGTTESGGATGGGVIFRLTLPHWPARPAGR